MDGSGGASTRRSLEHLSVDSSSVGSHSPGGSPASVFRSAREGSNGDPDAVSAKLSSLYKEIGWLKIKLLSAGDGHADSKADACAQTRSELQARLDLRVAEHAALLNQRATDGGNTEPTVREPLPVKEEPRPAQEEPQPPEFGGFLARAKHGLAHMLHLDSQAEKQDGRFATVTEPLPSAPPAADSSMPEVEPVSAPAPPAVETKEASPNHAVVGRVARSFPDLVKSGNGSLPQAETSKVVAESEGLLPMAETAGIEQSTGLQTSEQHSHEDAPDGHVSPSSASSPSSDVKNFNISSFDGAVATARKAAEAAAAAVHKAAEAVSARATSTEEKALHIKQHETDGENSAAAAELHQGSHEQASALGDSLPSAFPAVNPEDEATTAAALATTAPADAAQVTEVAHAADAVDTAADVVTSDTAVVFAGDAAIEVEAVQPVTLTEAAALLEPNLAPVPPKPAAPPPSRNSKKQLVKLRGLMDTLQKEAQASHKERAALESRARRLDVRLQAVQARTMRSERAEEERRKAEAEMATLRRALNARLRKEASRQPIIQSVPHAQEERVSSVGSTSTANTVEFPLSARRSLMTASAAEFGARRETGHHTPRMSRSLSRPEANRRKVGTGTGRLDGRRSRHSQPTPAAASSPSPAVPSTASDSVPSLNLPSPPSGSAPPWLRGGRLGPGLPSTPRGESPFRQHSPSRAARSPRRSHPSSPVLDRVGTNHGIAHTPHRHSPDGSPERQPSPSEGSSRHQHRHNAHVWRQPSEGSDGSSALEEESLKWHEPKGHAEGGVPSVPQQVFDRVRSDVNVNSSGGNNNQEDDVDIDIAGEETISPTKESTPSVVDAFEEGTQKGIEGEVRQRMQAAGAVDPNPTCYVVTWEDSERGTSEIATLPSTPAQPVGRETMSGSAHPANDGGATSSSLPCWTTSTIADQHQTIGPSAPSHERASPPFSHMPVPPRGSAAFSELGTSTATAVAAAVASASAVLSHSRNSSAEFFDDVCGSRMGSQMGSANTVQSGSANIAMGQYSGETGMAFSALAEEEPTMDSCSYWEGPSPMGPSPPAQQTRALAWRSPDHHGDDGVMERNTDAGAAAVVAAVASSAAVTAPPGVTPTANGASAAATSGSASVANSSSGQSPLLRLWSPPPAPRSAAGPLGDVATDGKPATARGRAGARSQSRRNSPSPGRNGQSESPAQVDALAAMARAASGPTPLAFGSRSPARGQQSSERRAASGTSGTAVGRKSSPGQRVLPSAGDASSAGPASPAAPVATPAGSGAAEGWHHRLATSHTKSSQARRERRNASSTAELLEEGAKLLESNQDSCWKEPLRPFRRSGINIGVASRSGFR